MSDLKMKYEYVERKHPKLFTGIHQLCWHHNNSSADKLVEYIFDIEQPLQQAHRAGWEQCHRKVNNLLNEVACGLLTMEQFDKAIAATEYKGEGK